MKAKKKAQTSLPALRKKAFAMFSKHVRYGAVDDSGHVRCVSCGASLLPQEAHCGHLIHAGRQSPLSYDKRNCHPQCRNCNFFGMQGLAAVKYTLYVQQKYGPGIVEELLAIKHSKVYLKRPDLEAIIDAYREYA